MRTRWFFGFFLASGFCSLVYEVVWLRLAMAAFGVTTPMVSIVLSVFMAGLAVGSWGAGRLTLRIHTNRARTVLRLYAICELLIGVSGLAVPRELEWGHNAIDRFAGGLAWGSSAHYLASGVWIAAVLLPFCTAMGATMPLAMAALREAGPEAARRSFSYLYLANVIGATSGTLISALFLIEMFGFRRTLLITQVLNALLALLAFWLSERVPAAPARPASADHHFPTPLGDQPAPWLLFTTGLLSMAMEVVWVRQFTPYLGTVVYAFAAILALYLGATFLGSIAYRRRAASGGGDTTLEPTPRLWLLAGLAALAPLLLADPRALIRSGALIQIVRVALGIGPFCFMAGFLTPMLIDRWSRGDPLTAGKAYAVNVVGCILGPLVACFALLPVLGEHWSLTVLSLPLFGAALVLTLWGRSAPPLRVVLVSGALSAAAALALVTIPKDFETVFTHKQLLRDYTATVIAEGEGMEKVLLVNGYGMTVLSPVTKMMAHLPLAFRTVPPRRVLVICFGMGTSFRSSVSWGVPTTAVELLPSVPNLFGYFHADAARVLASPGAEVVVDDGRRFLERTRDRFDVITVDPPPPLEAAGSSLLYSREFFEEVKSHLSVDGILQEWFPGGDQVVYVAVARSLKATFPYVRVFGSHLGWGYHFLASLQPLPHTNALLLASRVPERAAADMVEWEPGSTPVAHFAAILSNEASVDEVIEKLPGTPALTDDRPLNEYFLLRELRGLRSSE